MYMYTIELDGLFNHTVYVCTVRIQMNLYTEMIPVVDEQEFPLSTYVCTYSTCAHKYIYTVRVHTHTHTFREIG